LLTIIGRHLRRFRRDRRGVSNIIVVALSLIIITMIVSNIVLWSYQLTQLDWERLNESLKISNVTRATNSSWFATQNEYIINKGSWLSGTYKDTQAADSAFETFRETTNSVPQQETLRPNAAGQYADWSTAYPSGTSHWDCCNENPPDDDSSYVETNVAAWRTEAYNLQDHSGSGTINWIRIYARAKLASSGSNDFRTLIRTYGTNYESSDISLSTSYQTVYTQYTTNPSTGLAWTWTEIDGLQAGASGQKVGSINTRLTAVWVEIDYASPSLSELDIKGTFAINILNYPLSSLTALDIQLRYRVSDSGEKWFLKAYNWTSASYSDNGFNSTSGHAPATGWDTYAVSVIVQWRSYVHDNGTIYIKLVDQGADAIQTTAGIDFLGVSAKFDGAQFTFKNEGSSSAHVVSLWIINSTLHKHYDADAIVNSAETYNYTRADVKLPSGTYSVKIITEKGNTAVYSG
jgi:hypothetical protein